MDLQEAWLSLMKQHKVRVPKTSTFWKTEKLDKKYNKMRGFIEQMKRDFTIKAIHLSTNPNLMLKTLHTLTN